LFFIVDGDISKTRHRTAAGSEPSGSTLQQPMSVQNDLRI